ncbi:MAG TPA: flavodoxin family protein [Armatimonadota bacterium]|jgi:multimeric flavodoxin WrbA/putative sterol carrier protein
MQAIEKTKVFVVNGSPAGAKGNTEVLIQAFLEGAREAGAESEVAYLNEKRIEACRGCFTCWTGTPGVCIHDDDMPALLEKLGEADVVVYATPLYVYTVSGLMKDFMDRHITRGYPDIVIRNGVSMHPLRHDTGRRRRGVVISNCGFPEQSHFSGLKETFRRMFAASGSEPPMICCAAGVLLRNAELQKGVAWYVDATRSAGREVIETGRISPETQAKLDTPLISDPNVLSGIANAIWRDMGVAGTAAQTDEELARVDEIPATAKPLTLPVGLETVRILVAAMPAAFDAEAAGDMHAVIQFVVTDEQPGRYFLHIADGRCTAYEGVHPAPTTTITTPAAVWLGVTTGSLDNGTAVLSGQYTPSGDLRPLLKMGKMFPQ